MSTEAFRAGLKTISEQPPPQVLKLTLKKIPLLTTKTEQEIKLLIKNSRAIAESYPKNIEVNIGGLPNEKDEETIKDLLETMIKGYAAEIIMEVRNKKINE